jgi:hypothetical protein
MLAAVVLGKKIVDAVDERAKKKEEKQGLLNSEKSNIAKRAFASQAKAIQGGPGEAGIQRQGTEIKYEGPDSFDLAVTAITPTTPGVSTPVPEYRVIQSSPAPSQPNVGSPVRSEKRPLLTAASPMESAGDSASLLSPRSSIRSAGPPPYSPRAEESPLSPASLHSQDADTLTLTNTVQTTQTDTTSILSAGSSRDGNSLRIRTRGSDLKSGFPYHPALFELNVHPTKWDAFTTQLIETTKFKAADHAQIWATAAGVAMTGAILTSVFIGRYDGWVTLCKSSSSLAD